MKKIYTALVFILLLGYQTYGQLESGSIAPDFIATDINGVDHNLYDLLDEGKIVILDFYATWCEPCWDLHNQEVLKDIWNEYGPDGTDEVYVFSIETDLSTTSEELNGTGNTLGDWVTGVPYPIIDETEGNFTENIGSIGETFNVSYYPTIYMICPARILSEDLWQNTQSNFETLFNGGCPAPVGENNIQILEYNGVEGAFCDEVSFVPVVEFQNFGSQNIVSATAQLSMDGIVQEQVEYVGNLGTFSIDTIAFSPITVGPVDIDIEITSVNGINDDIPENNIYNASIAAPNETDLDSVTVEIMTDFFGSEIYWAIFDEDEQLVAEGGNLAVGLDVTVENLGADNPPSDPSAYPNDLEQLYSTTVFLPSNGCYKFVIADYFLDGFCCGLLGDGFYRVVSSDNGVLIDEPGDFIHIAERPFAKTGNGTSTTNIIENQIKLSPNPTSDKITIDLSGIDNPIESLRVSSITGNVIYKSQMRMDKELIELDMSLYENGIYLLTLELEDKTVMINKIIKQE